MSEEKQGELFPGGQPDKETGIDIWDPAYDPQAPHAYQMNWWDPDHKYSKWRRDYPYSKGNRNLYCTDLDWVEWRNGQPKAFVETTRCFGKDPEECAYDYATRNKGFQADVVTRIAGRCMLKAYLVVIEDPAPHENDNYEKAKFHIYQIQKVEPGKFSLLREHAGEFPLCGPDEYLRWLKLL